MSFGDRPRVTPTEWKEKVRVALANDGFNDKRLDQLEAFFQQNLTQNPARPDWKPGIDEPTLAQTMSYLREHKNASPFTDEQLNRIEEIMKKYITLRT